MFIRFFYFVLVIVFFFQKEAKGKETFIFHSKKQNSQEENPVIEEKKDPSKKVFDSILVMPNEESALFCQQNIIISHLENEGIGFTKGYTSIEGLFFFPRGHQNHLPILDAKLHVFNDKEINGNLGGGFRFSPSGMRNIFGFNAYLDYRNDRDFQTFQIGIGAEMLTKYFDFRINGYFPINSKHSFDEVLFDNYEGGYNVSWQAKEIGITWTNFEVGSWVLNSSPLGVYGALGSYYLKKNNSSNRSSSFGFMGRLKLRIKEMFFIDGVISRDRHTKTNRSCQLSIRFPFGSKTSKNFYKNKWFQPIDRNEIIALERYNIWGWNY